MVRAGVKISQSSPRPEVMANAALSILNISPKTRRAFPSRIGWYAIILRFLKSLVSVLLVLCQSLPALWQRKITFTEPCDILIISHLVNLKHLDARDDFYFGPLSSDMASTGLRTQTVLINHINATPGEVDRNGQRTTILQANCGPVTELFNFFNLVLKAFALKFDKIEPRWYGFGRFAVASAFDKRALANLRIHNQIRQAVTAMRPGVIIHTYEGHGWERMVAQTAHAQSWPITVIGYNHSVLFPGPRAIDFVQGNGRDPDYVCFAGKITSSIFMQESAFDPENVFVLGSTKLDNIHADGQKSHPAQHPCCLVVPEGEMSETKLMATVTINAARMMPEVEFVLRLHPVLDLAAVQSAIPALGSPPANFSFSKASLEHDLVQADWLIYRASSVVLNGLQAGITPIYLNTDQSQPWNDPLPQWVNFRHVADNIDELVGIMKTEIQGRHKGKKKKITEGMKFAADYFTKFDTARLMKTIERHSARP